MIIIETKTGPHMINERETIGCSFDKEKGEAIVTYNRDPREVVSFHEGIPLSKTEYPAWMWLVFIVYPFVPVINVVGFVFLLIMMSTAEKRQDMYLRGRFFEDVKRNKSEEGAE